ncbi:MAG: hypothetical protein WBM99_17190 [Psychromonas sp.]
MKNIYQYIYLPTFYTLLLIVMSNQVLAEDKIEEFPVMNVAPVILEELEQVRGLGGTYVTSSSSLIAVLSDNEAINNTTGYNTINGSFTEASGVFSIIQNTGNNVIIQDSTTITVTITPN